MTQGTLEGQLRDRRFGEYLDAEPGGWLIWTAGGLFGPKRYACPDHRGELVDDVRGRHGPISCVWSTEPYPRIWPDGLSGFDERRFAELLAGSVGS